ncbi:DUF1116 domain-containing protein [Actinosynnema sp. NPDC091369]
MKVAEPTTADALAVRRMQRSEPVFEDVAPAGEVVPGMTRRTILTSGAPLPWDRYRGAQRRAILGAAVFEGLAADEDDAHARLASGDIELRPCHDHGAVGSLTGVTTWSMPVVVVRDQANGTKGFCRLNEGGSTESLTFGVWSEGVAKQLAHVRDVVAPAFRAVLRATGGLPVRPVVRRALAMGDDLHSRHTASGALLRLHLLDALVREPDLVPGDARRALAEYLQEAEYLFLHVAMAASKAAADAASGVPGSGVVTAMVLSCDEFALRVSGLGREWFRAPLPPLADLRGRLFDDWTTDDLDYVGGESLITETTGLGGLAAAASFPLQDFSAGTPEAMVELTERMYRITVAEHPEYRIPALRYRGVPCGIDVRAVAATGIVPAIHLGATLRHGGHAGAGLFTPPVAAFRAAADTLTARSGTTGEQP